MKIFTNSFIVILTIFCFSNCTNLFSCANSENIYSFMYDGKKYEIVKESKNWSVAAACAVERGGYLVEINSLGEQNAIFSEISKAGISINYKPINDGGGTSYLWIDRKSVV